MSTKTILIYLDISQAVPDSLSTTTTTTCIDNSSVVSGVITSTLPRHIPGRVSQSRRGGYRRLEEVRLVFPSQIDEEMWFDGNGGAADSSSSSSSSAAFRVAVARRRGRDGEAVIAVVFFRHHDRRRETRTAFGWLAGSADARALVPRVRVKTLFHIAMLCFF